jgi:hypothetical protein
MIYFSIDIHFNTIDSDDVIRKPEISVYDTSFLGAVNQIKYIVSKNARSQIDFADVWYMGKTDVTYSEVLSYKSYKAKDFIAMINKVLGEELL